MFSHAVTLGEIWDPTDVVPVDLLPLLITTGIRPPERVLAHVRRLDDPWDGAMDRACAISAVAGHVDPDEALDLAAGIATEQARAKALSALAAHRPERVFGAARALAGVEWQARALTAVVPHLPDALRAEASDLAVAAAADVPDERGRFHALLALLPHPEAERYAVEAVADMSPDEVRAAIRPDPAAFRTPALLEAAWSRAGVVSRALLAPLLSAERRAEVLAGALALEVPHQRLEALVALIPHLPEESRAAALDRAWEAADSVADHAVWGAMSRVESWRSLVPHLSGERRDAALRTALAAVVAVNRENFVVFELLRLAPLMPTDLLAMAVAKVGATRRPCWRAPGLFTLARHLPAELLPRAVEAATAMGEPYWVGMAMAGIAPRLSADERRRHLADLRIVELL
ncbi:hypothetical protein [Virgisporangium aliadipatigenens]|uniref:hypothetical protein n=1 Tax=Virgisporangium aliadipatigenens TaxID=741659 RepID=UPI001944F2FB|nr:hypothetical protein [Virgisporangium aliadipatigenens]